MKTIKSVLLICLLASILLSSLAGCAFDLTTAPSTTEPLIEEDPIDESRLDDKFTLIYTKSDGTVAFTIEQEAPIEQVMTEAYGSNDKIEVILPKNTDYLAISLCDSVGEAIVFVPKGHFVYTFQADMKSYFPKKMYKLKNTIKIRVPSDEEIYSKRNLALNPYDVKPTEASAYPHVYASNSINMAQYGAHNAIDGIKRNTSYGAYPFQSWGPHYDITTEDYFTVDFGEETEIDELVIYLRAAYESGHDGYFTKATLEFADGTKKEITLKRTAKAQTFKLDSIKTSTIKIYGLEVDQTNSQGWPGITEIEVIGTITNNSN